MAEGQMTVLVEDTAGGRGLLGEHGLSFWLELGERKFLFDTGQGHVLFGNARRLGISLDRIDAILLSHSHYDHTGGLLKILQRSQVTRVYAHPAAFAKTYACNPDRSARDIGMPDVDEKTVRTMTTLVSTEEPTEIHNGLYLTGPIPRASDFEGTGGEFFQDPECTVHDNVLDDQAAFLETAAGTIVILGCAHAGVVNTLRYIRDLTKNRPLHTVIGGMHLGDVTPERMDRTVAEFRRLNVRHLLPCHCTGFAAMARLWHEFPTACATCRVGTVVQLAE